MSEELDDGALLAGFEGAGLPPAQWTPRAHVRVAFLHVTRHGLDEAVERMRAGLNAYLKAHRLDDRPDAGYHETITVTWLRVVESTIEHHGGAETSIDFVQENEHLCGKSLLRLFYTRERALSAEARARFMPPDVPGIG